MGYVMENERFIKIGSYFRLVFTVHKRRRGRVTVNELPWIAGQGGRDCLRLERMTPRRVFRGSRSQAGAAFSWG